MSKAQSRINLVLLFIVIVFTLITSLSAKSAITAIDYSHPNTYNSIVTGKYIGGYTSQLADFGVLNTNGKKKFRYNIQMKSGIENTVNFFFENGSLVNGDRWGYFSTNSNNVEVSLLTY